MGVLGLTAYFTIYFILSLHHPDYHKMTDNNVGVENSHENEQNVEEHEEEHDPYFEPIIHLPEVHIYSMEEDEEDLVKLRAKLFRYDTSEDTPVWKERGTGEIKVLYHLHKNTARVLMRRDKTWKICANHYISTAMKLRPNCDSDRAWMWSVAADFADETPKPELLAVRFANAENANRFKEAFEEAQRILEENEKNKDEVSSSDNSDGDDNGDDGDGDGDGDDDGDDDGDQNEKTENDGAKQETSSKDQEIVEKLSELNVGDANQQ